MKPLVLIRPQPGCDASVEAAKKLGLDAHGFPLFEIRARQWDPVGPDSFDALLIGSANAIRRGGEALGNYRGKPAYVVGARTAEVCRKAGLDIVGTGDGGLQDVIPRLAPGHHRLLRLTGAEPVPLDLPHGTTMAQRCVYASDPLPMPPELAEMLKAGVVVALHSADAARHFRALCRDQDADIAQISIAAIGPRVGKAAGAGWLDVGIAEQPSDEALLALARQMCEVPAIPDHGNVSASQEAMQDQTQTQGQATTQLSNRTGRGQVMIAMLAFLLGAAAVGWSAWRGYLDNLLPAPAQQEQADDSAAAQAQAQDAQPSTTDEAQKPDRLETISTVEARMAMLEDRLSRLDLQANAASGNAARAESLLIAFAARRMIDRGEPLRYLADQLQLRFSNAQPRAVRTVVNFAKRPVTIDELSTRLEALSPELTGESEGESFWDTAMRDLSTLFTVRREPSSLVSPEARLERAQVMLSAGRIPESIAEVKRLPGADDAATWLGDAQRYANVQQALDLLETAAMLEPTRLQDSEGNRVNQPSPLATPTDTPDAKSAG